MHFPWQRRRTPLDVRVAQALERAGLDVTGVAVAAERRRVTLRGTMPDDVSRERAVELARSIDGVGDVEDLLSVVAAPAVAAPPAGLAAEPPVYVVQPGDTLPDIAERLLGARSRWRELRDLNRKVVGGTGRLPPGLLLALPEA